MFIIAAIILAALFAVAAQAGMDGESAAEWKPLSQISAILAGLMMGVVFTPVNTPWNFIFGMFYAICFVLVINQSAARAEAEE